uniref:NERD domain-containing protein n=3 Tax=Nothobranchius TaxID=28779 RepID=A0A1A8MH97_9TELE
MNTSTIQLGNLFPHFQLSSKAPESAPSQSPKQLPTLPELLQHVIKLTGLRREDVYSNLRIPDQFQAAKDDISIVILTGQGVFCIDVKPWKGSVSAHNKVWHVQVKGEDQNFTNTCIEQMDDPLKAITTKTTHLCSHLKRSGVAVRSSLFFPRVIFLSPDCRLDEELMKRRELVSHSQIEDFLRSFREGYVAWMTDAVTPSWISGHLSYRQMESAREVLRRVGTWDMVQLQCGEQLKGDYQGCQFIALDRQETDTLEFSRVKTLSADSLWFLLGHVPKVTVKMYKRGSHSWLGKSLNATATIPSNTIVMFRINGEEFDAKIPANTIHSITLSI